MNNIAIVYTGATCGFCEALKDYLENRDILYEEKDTSDPVNKKELMSMGYMGVPVIKFGEEVHQGFSNQEDKNWVQNHIVTVLDKFAEKNIDERYINLVKKRECFKKLLDSKKILTHYSTFVCPKTNKIFSVVNNKDVDIELELVTMCDRECNIERKNLNLQIPPDIKMY